MVDDLVNDVLSSPAKVAKGKSGFEGLQAQIKKQALNASPS
ncbi:MAG: hypothetical protein ACMG6E_09750 [Candidatus Roizmanbacteria bacterium]